MKQVRVVLITICALLVGAVAFVFSGLYNVSARVPHLAPTALLLKMARDRSIANHSKDIELPSQDDPVFAMAGALHFDATCRKCHGAPGRPREEFAQGLYPAPPLLSATAKQRSRKEIFWILENGLKMTGMPAFGGNHQREEIIAMTAFINKIPEFDAQGYTEFVKQSKAHAGGGKHHHGASGRNAHPDDHHGHGAETNDHHH